MTESFAEVEEALRQDRLREQWGIYKPYIIGIIVGTILLTALISGYTSWNNSVQAKQTTILTELLAADDFPNNINPEGIKLRDSLKAMLLTQAAATHLEDGNTEQALSLYSYVAENVKGADNENALAALMTARLQAKKAPAETLEFITKKKNNIWRPQALLDKAAYEASVNGDYGQALQDIETVLATKDLLPSIRDKAQAMQHVYTIQSAEQEAK